MSVIIVAPKGTNKYDLKFIESLKLAHSIYKDGIGIAYREPNLKGNFENSPIYAKKVFYDFKRFYEYLVEKNLTLQSELILFFRQAGEYSITSANCQPYICTEEEKNIDFSVFEISRESVLFMEENLNFFINEDESKYLKKNPVYNFIKEFFKFKEIRLLFKNENSKFMQLFGHLLGVNKMVYIPFNSDIVYLGAFHTDASGYKYSKILKPELTIIKNGLPAPQESKKEEEKLNFSKEPYYALERRKIEVSFLNYKEIEAVFHKDAERHIFKKGDILHLKNFLETEDSILCTPKNSARGNYYYVKKEIIEECTRINPKSEFLVIYIDLDKLYSRLKPSKNMLKQLRKKLNSTAWINKEGIDSVNIKLGGTALKNICIGAIRRFYEENTNLLNINKEIEKSYC